MEHHPFDRNLWLENLGEMPGDRLTFAVLVGCEVDLICAFECLLEFLDLVPGTFRQHPDRVEVFIHVHCQIGPRLLAVLFRQVFRRPWQVAYVTHRGFNDNVVASHPAQEPANRLGFGRGLHDYEGTGHGGGRYGLCPTNVNL